MSRATLKATVASAVAAAGTFTVDYTSQAQADFTAGQTVTVRVYERDFTCAVTFGASAATVTWPAGAPYSLPAGEYYIDFDLIGGEELPRDASQATNIVDLTDNSGGTADGTLEATGTVVTGVDGTGSNAASKADVDARLVSISNNFADLSDKYNTLLANLKAAGLMEADS